MPLPADTATWISVGFAVGAAVLALAATLLLVVVLRGGRAADRPVHAPAGGLEGVHDERRRARLLAGIASSIDLDDVLQRILATAVEEAAVDAALLSVQQAEDEPYVATVGMTADEASRQPVATAPPGAARAVRISYRYGPDEERELREAGSELIRGGVAVPVGEAEESPLGTLAVFWRNENRGPEEGEVAGLELLAATAAPAIRNAQRFREAREMSDVDALTGLYNRRFFHETLGRECARAQRYERRLALVVFDVDDFEETNNRVGHAAGDTVLAAVAERLRRAVRRADVACRVGGDDFAVILPEAGTRDAEQLYRSIQFAVGSGSAGQSERVRPGSPSSGPRTTRSRSSGGPGTPSPGPRRRARGRCGAQASPRKAVQRRASSRAASCSRRRTSVCTSSRKRAQSDCSSAERKCPGGET